MENDNRKLYPLRFIDEGEDKAWGRVVYHIADLGYKDSMTSEGWLGGSTINDLMETYMERVVGDDAFDVYGMQFPLMLRVLDVRGNMPLQVSVPDEVAFERYDSLGKATLWYVAEASENALVYLGFSKDMDGGELYARCADGTLEETLNAVHPHVGDSFLIRPGTVFAAGQGLKLIEISESSELAFNIYNWGKELPEGEELMLEEALDVINYRKSDPEPLTGAGELAAVPEFKVTGLALKAAIHIFSDQPGSFALYHCVGGEVMVRVPEEPGSSRMTDYQVKPGHTLLVPSEVDDFYLYPLMEGTFLLEALWEKTERLDAYTGEKETAGTEVYDGGEDDEPDPHEMTWTPWKE